MLIDIVKTYDETYSKATINKDGTFEFKDLPASMFGNIRYRVEFTYDGINYKAVRTNVGSDPARDSNASEDPSERATFNDVLTEQFGVEEQTITSETISATISGDMRREAIVAVLVAVAFMLLYIWLRFSDIRFGISSVAALLHDVLIVLSFYAIARVSVGSTFIACMLTIVGYSINATIVIFDRVRENKKAAAEAMAAEAIAKRRNKKKGKEAPEEGEKDLLKEIVNKSISQTLSRSILTSITTLVMVVCLYIMGVSSIKEFALPLIVGIIAGGYSSVFIAGIVWRFLRIKFEPKYEEDDD